MKNMKPNKQRTKIMNRVFLVALALLLLFAFMDVQQVKFVKQIDSDLDAMGIDDAEINLWDNFWNIQQVGTISLWYGVLFALGIIWYIYSKDLSESIALFLVPATMIFFGTQDLIYFIIGPDSLSACIGEWADKLLPVRLISDLFGEAIPTSKSFITSGLLGIVIAWFAYKKLQKAKW